MPRAAASWSLLLLLGLVGPTGCRNQTSLAASQRGDVLAQVDDVVITVKDFQERINSQSPYVRARYTSLEHRKEFLENLVKFEILASEARRRGYQTDPEVVRAMKQVMVQLLMQRELDRVRMEDVKEEEVKAYFDAHPEEFNKPPEVRVSMILVADDKTAQEVLKDKRAQGLENAGFRELVQQYSLDGETKERGGDLRYFDERNRELPKPVVEAAFRLGKGNLGDVSGPVPVAGKGVALLKLTGKRSALVRSLDDVRQQIRSKLFRERREKLMREYEGGLRKKAEVKVFAERLKDVQVDSSGAPGAAGPTQLTPPPGHFHPPGQNAPQASPTTPPKPPETK